MTVHDPFNKPEQRHPHARELLPNDAFWSCADERAPFGSDEGNTAYHEFRRWRSAHPKANLVDCVNWILQGRMERFSPQLLEEESIAKVARGDESDSLDLTYDSAFALDTTICATALAQLTDEGTIDAKAKPFALIAIRRQLHPKILATWREHAFVRQTFLEQALRAIESS